MSTSAPALRAAVGRDGEQPEAEPADGREVRRRRAARPVVGEVGGSSPPHSRWNSLPGSSGQRRPASTHSSLTNTALPFASWPVTTRRTDRVWNIRRPRRTGRSSPATTARRSGAWYAIPASRPCSSPRWFVKLCAAPPYRFIRQSTPAARISSSNAARCSGGMSGSSAPMHTSTLPLIVLRVVGARGRRGRSGSRRPPAGRRRCGRAPARSCRRSSSRSPPPSPGRPAGWASSTSRPARPSARVRSRAPMSAPSRHHLRHRQRLAVAVVVERERDVAELGERPCRRASWRGRRARAPRGRSAPQVLDRHRRAPRGTRRGVCRRRCTRHHCSSSIPRSLVVCGRVWPTRCAGPSRSAP